MKVGSGSGSGNGSGISERLYVRTRPHTAAPALRNPREPQDRPEANLLELARAGTAAHVERIVRAWRRVADAEERAAERERHESRSLTMYIDDDGMYVVRGRLDPEAGALLEKALESAGEILFGRRAAGDRRASGDQAGCAAQRRADAIALVAERALSNTEDKPRVRPVEVVVHVDAAALRDDAGHGQAVFAGGARVSAETSRRLACDAGRVLMTHDRSGNTLNVGRRTSHAHGADADPARTRTS